MLDNETSTDETERLFHEAVRLVWSENKASTSFIQRKLAIGYNKAARLIERMEQMGIVTAANHVGKRQVHQPDDLRAALKLRGVIEDIAGNDAEAVLKAIVKDLKALGPLEEDKGHMKETPADRDVRDGAYRVTAGELRSFVERLERLAAEKKDIADQMKEVRAEAKARGYDVKALNKLIAERKRDRDDLAEEQAVLDLYREALGM